MKLLLTFFFRILGYIPTKWYKNGMIGILTTTMAFYSVGITANNILEKYTGLLEKSLIIEFLIYWISYYLVFYIVLDLVIRLIFHKWMKVHVYNFIKGRYTDSKIEHLRTLVDMRDSITKGANLPFELGYAKRSEIANENMETSGITVSEKEEFINEAISSINKWTCIGVHLLITSISLFHFNWILMSSIAVFGTVIMLFLYSGIVVTVHNIEAIPVIQERISKPKI